jgi:hypothetical protein
MTRPDDMYGPIGSRTQQWTQPYAGQPYPSQAPDPQVTGPQFMGAQAAGAQPPYQGYGTYQPYPQHQAYGNQYGNQWGPPSRSPFPAAPIPPVAPRPKASTGKIVALAVAAFLLVGVLGGAVLLVTGKVSTPGGTPSFGTSAAPAAVTMSLPPVIDGKPQIDNEYSRQLVDAARQQLAAVTADPVVGMYGDPGQPPAFVIIAGTTTAGDPDLVLTGMAAGFQQSLGSQELTFVDQPAGPLGGPMRCAEHAPMATCMWTVDGAFGMNMVFQQDLASAAATTLRVREAIETHAG